jgi:hypothetical protein
MLRNQTTDQPSLKSPQVESDPLDVVHIPAIRRPRVQFDLEALRDKKLGGGRGLPRPFDTWHQATRVRRRLTVGHWSIRARDFRVAGRREIEIVHDIVCAYFTQGYSNRFWINIPRDIEIKRP